MRFFAGVSIFMFWFQMISVMNNAIRVISNDAFLGLNELAVLIMRQTRLQKMPPVETVKDTLQILTLYENHITAIPQDYFEGFFVLRELSLSKNRLTVFPEVRPVRETLQILRISSNNITSISSSIIDNIYPSLTEVALCGNEITKIPTDTLSAWPNIQHFDIGANKLSQVDKEVFVSFNGSSDVQVNLYDNPWRCDAALSWFTELSMETYIETTGAVLICGIIGRMRFRNYRGLVCAAPKAYVGKPFDYLRRS